MKFRKRICPQRARRVVAVLAVGLAFVAGSGIGRADSGVSVLTQHNDNSRTGFIADSILTPGNVSSSTFGKLFSHGVDGYVFAQPLYLSGVSIPGKGVHNVVVVATEHDSVYAFDADDATGGNSDPLWQVSFIRPEAGITPFAISDIAGCTDMGPEVGITGTPVIDPVSATLYLVAATREGKTYHQRLHALDVATGAEKPGSPVDIASTGRSEPAVPDANRNDFDPRTGNQRAGLLLANGLIYIAWASFCDRPGYHGWVLAYDAATLHRVGVFNDTPGGLKGGIWQGGAGASADAGGAVFLVTGNGTFGQKKGKMNYGDCVLRFNAGRRLAPADYFAPYNQQQLSATDEDLGSCGALLLPDQPGPHPHLLVTAGKEGRIYVLDRDNLGHFHSGSDSQIVQSIPGALGEAFGMPALFANTVYFASMGQPLKAFSIADGMLSPVPTFQSSTIFPFPGATPSVSGNGSGEGIVWAIERSFETDDLVLHSYDAADVSHELYASTQAGARDDAGQAVKFTVPTVANGKVYTGGVGQVTVFGLF